MLIWFCLYLNTANCFNSSYVLDTSPHLPIAYTSSLPKLSIPATMLFSEIYFLASSAFLNLVLSSWSFHLLFTSVNWYVGFIPIAKGSGVFSSYQISIVSKWFSSTANLIKLKISNGIGLLS